MSEKAIARLEELRHRTGKESLSEIIEEVIETYSRLRPPGEVATYEQLSPRLREVLRMIGEGASTKEIARKLKVSRKTVEFHRARLMKRLEVEGLAGLVRYAVRVGAILP